uniref:Uncharacterized protein n=1 Tax=Ciona savignyi TaxID=51511 RepID=H2Z4K9_CIOSA
VDGSDFPKESRQDFEEDEEENEINSIGRADNHLGGEYDTEIDSDGETGHHGEDDNYQLVKENGKNAKVFDVNADQISYDPSDVENEDPGTDDNRDSEYSQGDVSDWNGKEYDEKDGGELQNFLNSPMDSDNSEQSFSDYSQDDSTDGHDRGGSDIGFNKQYEIEDNTKEKQFINKLNKQIDIAEDEASTMWPSMSVILIVAFAIFLYCGGWIWCSRSVVSIVRRSPYSQRLGLHDGYTLLHTNTKRA